MSEERPTTTARPVLRQVMTMHLMGSKFSELHYRIYADGKETEIVRHKSTDGSPNYVVTGDELRHGDETFDVLGSGGVGMLEWIYARISK